jgi:hypothetical protein
MIACVLPYRALVILRRLHLHSDGADDGAEAFDIGRDQPE